MLLTKAQQAVVDRMRAGDQLIMFTAVELYSLGSPRNGWNRLPGRTVRRLLDLGIVEQGNTVGYTTEFILTKK